MKKTTVHFLLSNEIAPEEVERLFAGLELFANTGDSFQEYCDFASKCPTFCPVFLFHEEAGRQLDLLPNENAHELFKVFRDYLRSIWRRDPVALREQVLKILIGIETKPLGHESLEGEEEHEDYIPERVGAVSWNERLEARSTTGSLFRDFPPRYRRALMLMRLHPDSKFFRPYFPKVMIDWESGEVLCQLRTDFQCAVYSLFRQSWRARICRECQKLFIAAKHPQMFCGTRCGKSVKYRRNREFWKNRGTEQRRKRNQEHRRTRKKVE
jgi:hypothetical protein